MIHLIFITNPVTPDVPNYFEGDIVLTSSQRAIIEQQTGDLSDSHERFQRAITRREDELWEGGKVPYVISSSLGECEATSTP